MVGTGTRDTPFLSGSLTCKEASLLDGSYFEVLAAFCIGGLCLESYPMYLYDLQWTIRLSIEPIF
jgi:hypothetical protein